jgi:hypothetical protein
MYIYGMKEAGFQWGELLMEVLDFIGFVPSMKDDQIFRGRNWGDMTTLGVYVDDGILTGKRKNILEVVDARTGKKMESQTWRGQEIRRMEHNEG